MKGGENMTTDYKRPLSFIVAIILFLGLFVGSVMLVVLVHDEKGGETNRELEWWKRTVIYHVYVPSFYDSDADSYGDIKGVTEKLDHIQNLGVDCIWLSPFYKFGGVDLGNDVSDHTKVDELFGTEEDLQNLFSEISRRGMHVILEFVPNHTSNESYWFEQSVIDPRGPYADFYVWESARGNDTDGNPLPPNNWKSAAGDSAWTWNEQREMFYYHSYLPGMPDLNLQSGGVKKEMEKILRFWLSKPSVLGFHIGGFNLLFEDFSLKTDEIRTNQTASIEFLRDLHQISNEYTQKDGLDRLFLLEMYGGSNVYGEEDIIQVVVRNATFGVAEVPFSFGGDIPWRNQSISGNNLHYIIEHYLHERDDIPAWPCWEINDHDVDIDVHQDGIGQDYGRIPREIHDNVLIASLLLPGTTLMYYGDEIGMASKTNITYEETQDPYAKYPYANESNYRSRSRDPYRTPMQWSSEKNAGFTSADKPWLPVAEDYIEVNVESQTSHSTGTQLELFHKLAALRHHKALHSGKVYFPIHNNEIFSFMRKGSSDGTSFLAVLNVGQPAQMSTVIDFTSILPGVSEFGYVLVTSSLHQNSSLVTSGQISMTNLTLWPQEGVVILLDFE